ncbi:MAG: hypothetical protein K2H85_06795, partial [Allobaculum sp.]|nr:hypothetical protein [Allobaculum sp.]
MGSCVHLLDNFYALETREPISDICSFDHPFITNEPLRKLLFNQITPMTDGWIKTPKDYIYRTAQLTRNLERFWSTNSGKFIKRMKLKELNNKDSALGIINHNPIFRLFVRGPMQNWRTTQHYFASVFNTIAEIPERNHYVVIPLADKIFARGMFNQLSNKISASSIRDKQSLQYCFFGQLYNFINVNCTLPSLFDDIPEEFRKTITLVFENSGHYLFWALQTLKDLNVRNKIYARAFNHFNGFVLRGITEKNAKANVLETMNEDDTSINNKDIELEIIKSYAQVTKTPIRSLVPEETETMDDGDDSDYISDRDAAELDELTKRVKTVPLVMGEKVTVLDITDVNAIIDGDE